MNTFFLNFFFSLKVYNNIFPRSSEEKRMTDELKYLAGGTSVAVDAGASVKLLGRQDVELEHARQRIAFCDNETSIRMDLSFNLLQEIGKIASQHFPVKCRKCDSLLTYFLKSPWEKWNCNQCGRRYREPVHACSVTPEECDVCYCMECMNNKMKAYKLPVVEKIPTPIPTPPPTPKPKKVKKKPSIVSSQLESDEHSHRQRLQSVWIDGWDLLIQMNEMFRSSLSDQKSKKEPVTDNVPVQKAIKALSHTTMGWNEGKIDSSSSCYTTTTISSEPELREFWGRIEKWFWEKPGDVVDELVSNLRFPKSMNKISVLSAVANALVERDDIVASHGAVLVELLVLRQYTQKPVDIDRDLLWEIPTDIPSYEATYTDWGWDQPGTDKRNGSIFSPVCSALRDQGPGGTKSNWSEQTIKKWIKWICTVSACCSQPTTEITTLWRGLGGGYLPSEVIESHRKLSSGSVIGWPALSSTSFNKQASIDYMLGVAVNSTSKIDSRKPGSILFKISSSRSGRKLQSISQYPEEEELLLGPFNMFTINDVKADMRNNFKNLKNEPMGLIIAMTATGPLSTSNSFYYEVRKEAVSASRKLVLATSSENQFTLENRVAILRPVIEVLLPNQNTRQLLFESERLGENCHSDASSVGSTLARLLKQALVDQNNNHDQVIKKLENKLQNDQNNNSNQTALFQHLISDLEAVLGPESSTIKTIAKNLLRKHDGGMKSFFNIIKKMITIQYQQTISKKLTGKRLSATEISDADFIDNLKETISQTDRHNAIKSIRSTNPLSEDMGDYITKLKELFSSQFVREVLHSFDGKIPEGITSFSDLGRYLNVKFSQTQSQLDRAQLAIIDTCDQISNGSADLISSCEESGFRPAPFPYSRHCEDSMELRNILFG